MPTALIVEDEPEANKLLGMLLKLRGYRSTPAFNGGDALEHLAGNYPDVVFLDLMLPDVDGFEVCRRVKRARATCLIPVVVVTARIAHENRLESYRAGADDFVPKPYMPEQIFRALERAEEFRRMAADDVVERSTRLADPSDGDVLRELACLRDLIRGRTPLPPESADRLGRAIDEARARIDRWTFTHPEQPPASLRFELTPERLVLTFEDQLAWLDAPGDPPPDFFAAGFEEVAVDRRESRLTLVKTWDAP